MQKIDFNEYVEDLKKLPYVEQLDELNELENEILDEIEELEENLTDIAELKEDLENEYQEQLCGGVLQALKDVGYDIPLDENNCLSIPFGDATVFIPLGYISSDIDFHFSADKDQLSYREKIASLLPDYIQDGNNFHKQTTLDKIAEEVVELVKRLSTN